MTRYYTNHNILIVVVLAGREAGWGHFCLFVEINVLTQAQDGNIIFSCVLVIFGMCDSPAHLG